jgi:triosephosphate isomerase
MSASPPVERTFWLGTSWKMTKSIAEAAKYADELAAAVDDIPNHVELFVLPPFTMISLVAQRLAHTRVRVGAQNAHWASSGAYTGEVSTSMVAEAGATIVEIGHSERRAAFGETDTTVNLKTKAVLSAGLRPLVCVGEPWEEREFGTASEYVVRQVKVALAGIPAHDISRVMVAYEPVWAIGDGGRPATASQVREMHSIIRAALVDRYGEAGEAVPLLYGGSVNQDNAAELASQEHVDGLFVGRAAWTADGYLSLARLVATTVQGVSA